MQTLLLSTWISDSTKPSFLQVIRNSGVCRCACAQACMCVFKWYTIWHWEIQKQSPRLWNLSSESTNLRQWALLGKSASLVMHCWPCPKVHRSFSPMLLKYDPGISWNYYLSYQIQQSTLLMKHLWFFLNFLNYNRQVPHQETYGSQNLSNSSSLTK